MTSRNLDFTVVVVHANHIIQLKFVTAALCYQLPLNEGGLCKPFEAGVFISKIHF